MNPWEVHAGPMERGLHIGAGLLGGLLILWDLLLYLMGGAHAETVHSELQPRRRMYIGEVLGMLSPVGGIDAGGGAEESTPLKEKE